MTENESGPCRRARPRIANSSEEAPLSVAAATDARGWTRGDER